VLSPPHGRHGALPVAENAPTEQTQEPSSSCESGPHDSTQMPSEHNPLLQRLETSQDLPVGIRHLLFSAGSRPSGQTHWLVSGSQIVSP